MAPDGSALLRDADLCVKCGLCLPHCPTYRVARDEGDSPRGRIALMQGFASGAVPVSPALEGHLDRCLACRACEAVCPADVPYGRLIDGARLELVRRRPARARLARVMAGILTRRALRALAILPLLVYQRLGVQALVRRLHLLGRGRLARLESLLPALHWPRRRHAAAADAGPPVMLFHGCTSPLVEPETLAAAGVLLGQLGHSVVEPPAQTCCGALHQHAGLVEGAQRCARRNLAAFAGTAPIAGIASGCTAQLTEYAEILPGDAAAAAFGERSVDLATFLERRLQEQPLAFRPLPQKVLLQSPCTLRNVLRADGAVAALLRRVPQLQVTAMDSGCCGAAGSYFISQPEMADRLLEIKLEQVRRARPDAVLSSNVGCAMHLAAGLRRARLTVPVLHPLVLLARQSGASSASPAREPAAHG